MYGMKYLVQINQFKNKLFIISMDYVDIIGYIAGVLIVSCQIPQVVYLIKTKPVSYTHLTLPTSP
jgi:hypothetical protein